MKRKISFMIALILLLGITSFTVGAEEHHNLTLMGTADLHHYVMPFNYLENEPADDFGFAKTYTKINEIRQDRDHTLLFDGGDTIQGSLIGDLEVAVEPLKEGETPTIIRAMNEAEFDAAAIGNHEVQDFGLDYFDKALEGSEFPWLGANFFTKNDGEYYTKPYIIIEKEIAGKELDVGVISFVPPGIMSWGRTHLESEVEVEEIMNSAENYMPELKQKTDLVILNSHTGLGDEEPDSYNAAYYIAEKYDIDAMLLAHDGHFFPDELYADLEGVNIDEGTVHGVPTTMPHNWGGSLGVIDLYLSHDDGNWEIADFNVSLEVVDEDTEIHPKIESAVAESHQKTLEFAQTPIGETEISIAGYFSEFKDNALTQLINEAQLWYAEQNLNNTEYEDLPLISVAAPFQTHTDVEAGELLIGDIAAIYYYFNLPYIIKIDGEGVIEYLEKSAEHFEKIDPELSDDQFINRTPWTFDWDIIEGIEYEVDISQPEGDRIVNAKHEGEPLTEADEFLLVTNDYRAGGGGNFPYTGEEAEIVLASEDYTRYEIADYVEEKETINPEPSSNWKLKPVEVQGDLLFTTEPGAKEYLEEYNNEIRGIEYVKQDEDGNDVFRIEFEKLGRF